MCGDAGHARHRREKLVDRAEREEAERLAGMREPERGWESGGVGRDGPYHALKRCVECGGWQDICGCPEPAAAPPLTAPLGRVAHWSNRRCHWWKLARLIQAVLLACAMVACTPAPAWMPDDPPLEIWAPDDAVWAAMERGCAAWGPAVGLECARATDREVAIVTAALGEPVVGDRASTVARPDFGGTEVWEQEYHVTFRGPEFLEPEYSFVAAHEVGHVIGVWHHLPESGHLMSWDSIASAVPTAADVDALLEVWGMTEAEL